MKKSIDLSKPLRNHRHEAFAQDLFSGMSATDAYRNHYSTERMKDKTVHEAASRLHSKVIARVQFLESQVADQRIVEKAELAEMYSARLRAFHQEFLEKGVDAARSREVRGLGKALSDMMGYESPEKHEHVYPDWSDILAEIEREEEGADMCTQ